MALKFFPEAILLFKVDHFEGILNLNKFNEMISDRLPTVGIESCTCAREYFICTCIWLHG